MCGRYVEPSWSIVRQVHGAAGATDDLPLSMFYRQARLARIYDGADEVHKMVVARRILAGYESSRRPR